MKTPTAEQTMIDRRPEILALASQLYPTAERISVGGDLDNETCVLSGSFENSWHVHAWVNKDLVSIFADTPDQLAKKLRAQLLAKIAEKNAPPLVDMVPADQLASVVGGA